MKDDEFCSIAGDVVCVTGAAGFVGARLCERLVELGAKEVRAIDLHFPGGGRVSSNKQSPDIVQIEMDISDFESVAAALHGAGTVFHLASAGMSGAPMLNKLLCERVNVTGTKNVVRACREGGSVSRLIYTSTYNVVFGGQEIHGGNEELPYFSGPGTDYYAPSKQQAELEALSFHSACSLRPAAIYGDGEARHFPRIAMLARLGLFKFVIGGKDVLVDWLHVDCLVQAQLLAAEALLIRGSTVRGQSFFISDGEPQNNFEFLRPLCEELGVPFPALRVPTWLALRAATVFELMYRLFGISPMLTRAEVQKVGVTHYFSTKKAFKILRYCPSRRPPNAIQSAAKDIVARRAAAASLPVVVPHFFWWLLIVGGISAVAYLLATIQSNASLEWLIFLRVLLWGAIAAHVMEAAIAMGIAYGRGRNGWIVMGWVFQTALLGGPSLRLLMVQRDL